MTFINGLSDEHLAQLHPCAATIGFFDGVHLGHRYLIRQVAEAATARSLSSLLITFPVHPRRVMQSNYQPQLLSTFAEKCRLLSTTQADNCLVLPFTRELASLSAHDFMQQVLYERLQVRTLVIGHDHRFGHNRSEGFEDYVRYGKDMGIEVIQAKAYQKEETNISSSVIRLLLKEGEVDLARQCLGYRYFLEGHVTSGHQIGRTLGYPTANLIPESPEKVIPADGVYAVWVHTSTASYKGMLNIGLRPTIGQGEERTIEVHLLGFNNNLYNQPIRLEFVARLRNEKKFLSREALAAQLRNDALETDRILS